jgi:hypothetical protein
MGGRAHCPRGRSSEHWDLILMRESALNSRATRKGRRDPEKEIGNQGSGRSDKS